MKAVINSSPLISFAIIDRLDILDKIYEQIIIPQEVYNETIIEGLNKKGYKKVKLFDNSIIKVILQKAKA